MFSWDNNTKIPSLEKGNHMFMYINMQAFKDFFVMHEYEKYIHVKLKIPQKYHLLLSFFCYRSLSLSKVYVATIHNEKCYYDLRIPRHIFILIFKFSTEVNVGLFFINVCINRQFTFHSS